jgi:hypothetical protein
MTACVFWTSEKQTSANMIRTDGTRVFISASFGKISPAVEAIRRKREPPIRVPEKAASFSRAAQRNAFRRDAFQQSRSFDLMISSFYSLFRGRGPPDGAPPSLLSEAWQSSLARSQSDRITPVIRTEVIEIPLRPYVAK